MQQGTPEAWVRVGQACPQGAGCVAGRLLDPEAEVGHVRCQGSVAINIAEGQEREMGEVNKLIP